MLLQFADCTINKMATNISLIYAFVFIIEVNLFVAIFNVL